jgi:hypothetical protein
MPVLLHQNSTLVSRHDEYELLYSDQGPALIRKPQ